MMVLIEKGVVGVEFDYNEEPSMSVSDITTPQTAQVVQENFKKYINLNGAVKNQNGWAEKKRQMTKRMNTFIFFNAHINGF